MLRYISLSYYTHDATTTLADAITRYSPAYGYVPYIANHYEVEIVMHFPKKEEITRNGVKYTGLAGKKGFWHIPLATLRYIKSRQPDVVVVEGFTFPLNIILLRYYLGPNCLIIIQHHGERPYTKWPKLQLQKIAGTYTNACFFTSASNAAEWSEAGIIKKHDPCYEIMEASATLAKHDKIECKERLGMHGNINFLWVGRLDKNKDPLTCLAAFEEFAYSNPHTRLYMIYQTEDLLSEVTNKIEQSEYLQPRVMLVGKIEHADLATWYSAADFYISCSHRESTGYALLEAMACGCIPIVTSIPSFKKITANGAFGLLYKRGNVNDLLQKLNEAIHIDQVAFSENLLTHYYTHLSAQSQAKQIYQACQTLLSLNA